MGSQLLQEKHMAHGVWPSARALHSTLCSNSHGKRAGALPAQPGCGVAPSQQVASLSSAPTMASLRSVPTMVDTGCRQSSLGAHCLPGVSFRLCPALRSARDCSSEHPWGRCAQVRELLCSVTKLWQAVGGLTVSGSMRKTQTTVFITCLLGTGPTAGSFNDI